jgi:hypothetical protein
MLHTVCHLCGTGMCEFLERVVLERTQGRPIVVFHKTCFETYMRATYSKHWQHELDWTLRPLIPNISWYTLVREPPIFIRNTVEYHR